MRGLLPSLTTAAPVPTYRGHFMRPPPPSLTSQITSLCCRFHALTCSFETLEIRLVLVLHLCAQGTKVGRVGGKRAPSLSPGGKGGRRRSSHLPSPSLLPSLLPWSRIPVASVAAGVSCTLAAGGVCPSSKCARFMRSPPRRTGANTWSKQPSSGPGAGAPS